MTIPAIFANISKKRSKFVATIMMVGMMARTFMNIKDTTKL